MRVMWILAAILAVAATAKGVTISCVNEANGVVRIDYDASDEAALPTAFAIDVTVVGGATIEKVYDYKVGESTAAAPGYGIFLKTMEIDENGKVVNWGAPVVSGGAGTASATLEMASKYAGKANAPKVKGTLCRIQINTAGASMASVGVKANADGGGIVLENATAGKFNASGTVLGVRLDKFTVTAGSKAGSDSISASGYIDVGAGEFQTPGTIVVTVSSANLVSACVQTFPIDGSTFKNGKYKCTQTVGTVKASFAFDTASAKFTFSAKNVSLKGLSCPFKIEAKIGGYTGASVVDETVANGLKKPIPIKLMMGVKDTLRIDKVQVKRSTAQNGDSMTVKGGFAVLNTGVNMVNEAFYTDLGLQTFTVPAGNFKANANGFSCSKIVMADGSNVSANFNFKTGAFTLSIKKTKITAGAGSASLGIRFGTFNQTATVNIQ